MTSISCRSREACSLRGEGCDTALGTTGIKNLKKTIGRHISTAIGMCTCSKQYMTVNGMQILGWISSQCLQCTCWIYLMLKPEQRPTRTVAYNQLFMPILKEGKI